MAGYRAEPKEGNSTIPTGAEELRLRVQQLSLREQIERNHFLLMRLNAANARLIQSLEHSDVFEAIAEGGITRFLALYQDTQPDYIGPVRSARFYYIQWELGFDAPYAHVGGSPEALQDINDWHVKNLDQFYNAGAYQRISSRYAPHNVYTSIAQLNQLEASKGFGKSNYNGFVRKKEAASKTPNATDININFSGYNYDAHYDYNVATNTYKRSQAGAAHTQLIEASSFDSFQSTHHIQVGS